MTAIKVQYEDRQKQDIQTGLNSCLVSKKIIKNISTNLEANFCFLKQLVNIITETLQSSEDDSTLSALRHNRIFLPVHTRCVHFC